LNYFLDILQFDLEEEDKFIVIASDGVWEFLSNQQIVDYVAPYFNKNHLESACDKVVREATLRWKAVTKRDILEVLFINRKMTLLMILLVL